MGDLGELAARQGDVFTTAQAIEDGWDERRLADDARSGVLHKVRRGAFAFGPDWDSAPARKKHRIQVAAALLLRGWDFRAAGQPKTVGGHWSAGYLHGLPVPLEHAPKLKGSALVAVAGPEELTEEAFVQSPTYVHLVSADKVRRAYRLGVHERPAELWHGDVTYIDGVPVTSLARTAADMMREGTRRDAVITADAALHLGLDLTELMTTVRRCARWANGAQALWAAEFANGLAESPAESFARLVLHDFGLTSHELQVELYDLVGKIGRVDFLFRAQRTVLEVDGLVKLLQPWDNRSPEQVIRDQEMRERRLRAAGWQVVRTTWAELLTAPERLWAKLIAAFAAAQAAG